MLGSNSSHRARISNSIKLLSDIFVVEKSAKQGNVPRLKTRIKELLEAHEATEQEIEHVYNHILAEMLGGKK